MIPNYVHKNIVIIFLHSRLSYIRLYVHVFIITLYLACLTEALGNTFKVSVKFLHDFLLGLHYVWLLYAQELINITIV